LKSLLNQTMVSKRINKDPLVFDNVELTFINATMYNTDLIAYSQRHFLHEQFLPTHYGLEDTNIPFDWDHISPQKAISFRGIPKPIESAYRTIGNLRAWPYRLNRMDQANSPNQKFNPLRASSKEDKVALLKDFEVILKRPIKSTADLKRVLMEVSICDRDWENCAAEKLRNRSEWKQVFDLILKRNIRLFQNWYDDLLIDQLFPVQKPVNFEVLFYANTWQKNQKDNKHIVSYFDYSNNDYWLSKPIMPNIHLYFGYAHGNELANDSFAFGLIEKSNNGILRKIKIPEKIQAKYSDPVSSEEISDIPEWFTLISTEQSSYNILLQQICQWVKDFPDKTLRNIILEYFLKTLKKENIKYFAINNNSNR